MPFLVGALLLATVLRDKEAYHKHATYDANNNSSSSASGARLVLHQWSEAPGSTSQLITCDTGAALVLIQGHTKAAHGDACTQTAPRLLTLSSGKRSDLSILEDFERCVIIDKEKQVVSIVSGGRETGVLGLDGRQSLRCKLWYLSGALTGHLLFGDNEFAHGEKRAWFCLPLGALLHLDVRLFENSPSQLARSSASTICASISGALGGSGFAVTSDAHDTSAILQYWLNFCGIEAPSVHLWHQTHTGEASSPCDVHSITGLDDSIIDSTTAQLDCIEDFLSLLSRSQRRIGTSAPSSFVFASNLGRKYDGGDFIHLMRVIYGYINHFSSSSTSDGAASSGSIASLEVKSLWAVGKTTLQSGTVRPPSSNVVERFSGASSCYSSALLKLNVDYAVGKSYAFVLIFVLPGQLPEAQSAVDRMKRMCNTQVCHLYISFYIFAVPSEEQIHGKPTTRQLRPSMRMALLKAREVIKAFMRTADIVTILVGIKELAAFPGILPDRGVLPIVAYGGSAKFRLPASIIVASAETKGAAGKVVDCVPYSCDTQSLWEPGAVVGDVLSISKLLDRVLTGNASIQASDVDLRCEIIRYASMNPQDVMLDIEGQFFDFPQPLAEIDVSTHENLLPSSALGKDDPNMLIIKSVQRLQSIAPDQCILTEATYAKIEAAGRHLFDARDIEHVVALSSSIAENCISCSTPSHETSNQQHYCSLPAIFLLELARSAESLMLSGSGASLQSCRKAAEHLTSVFGKLSVSSSKPDRYYMMLASLYGALAGFNHAFGDFAGMISAYSNSIFVEDYWQVERGRSLWQHQRQHLRQASQGLPVTHYVTMASNMTDNLRNLQLTAEVSGISLTVLGIGNKWVSYSDKLHQYSLYLSTTAASDVQDDDVVVLIDAYDVLLFPAARRIGAILAEESKTPIVFCAENGIYPEIASAGLVRQGANRESGWQSPLFEQRFLNSGCIAGRAGQMRTMLQEADSHGFSFQNDQHFFTRYALAHPDIVSVDFRKRLFATTFKLSQSIQVDLDLRMMFQDVGGAPLSFGIVHFNNILSSNTYQIVAAQLTSILDSFYRGREDGLSLLRVTLHLSDGDFHEAAVILRSPHVQANFTSSAASGGVNCVGEYLMMKYADEVQLNPEERRRFSPGWETCKKVYSNGT